METFKILCFSANVLEAWEEVQAEDLLSCLAKVRDRAHCHRIEIWKGSQRAAILKQAGSTETEGPLKVKVRRGQ